MGNPNIQDQVQDALRSSQGEPNATHENKFELWKSAASATAKLFLRAAKESADAFPPLKSVVGGLCFILDNYEVWRSPSIHNLECSQVPPANKGKQTGNRVIGTQDQGPLCLTLQSCS